MFVKTRFEILKCRAVSVFSFGMSLKKRRIKSKIDTLKCENSLALLEIINVRAEKEESLFRIARESFRKSERRGDEKEALLLSLVQGSATCRQAAAQMWAMEQ